jgi:hypothetical protein
MDIKLPTLFIQQLRSYMSVNLLHNICFLLWLIRNCTEAPNFSQIQITLLLLVTVCTSVLPKPHSITAHKEHTRKALFLYKKFHHTLWWVFLHNGNDLSTTVKRLKVSTSKTFPGYVEQLLYPKSLWQTYNPQSIDRARGIT